MKILLVAKHVAGAFPGEFYYPGEWSNVFQLGRAVANTGVNVSVLTPRVYHDHCERFEKEFGAILKQESICHHFAPTDLQVRGYGGSFRLRMFLGEMRALMVERPDIVAYIGIGPSLLVGIPRRPPIVLFSCWGPSEFDGDREDAIAKRTWSSPMAYCSKWEDRVFRVLARRWGALDKHTLLNRVDAIAIWHPSGFEALQGQSDLSGKVFLTPKGVDLTSADLAEPLERQIDVLFVGGILHRKGIFHLLEAFCQVNRVFPKAVLGIAGSGPPKNIEELKARMRKVPVNAVYFGSVAFSERWRLYKSSKIFGFPSLNDFYPSAMMEAMACKLPVVTSQVVDSPVEDGVTGFNVPPGDVHKLGERLIWLLKNDVERKRMGCQARMRVKDWKTVAETALQDVILPLLKGREEIRS